MPKPQPLRPGAQRKTLAHRLTRVADRLRQLNTRFGLRSQRVFLVWTRWTGDERGEGDERELYRVELLPTPRVSDLSAIALRPWAAGVVQEGTLRVDQISAGAYTFDNLVGRVMPPTPAMAPSPREGSPVDGESSAPVFDDKTDFFWEVHEDSRGDPLPSRVRFRVFGHPARKEGSLYWTVMLEAQSDENDRFGQSRADEEDV